MADESVEIFVGAALPGGVGIGEVDIKSEMFFNSFEAGEFEPVVERQCSPESLWDVEESFDDGAFNGLGFSVSDGGCK